jgi:dihydroorotate dehydrogenase
LLYRLFFKLVLVHIDAERAHGMALRWLARMPFAARKPSPRLALKVLGRTHPTPLGVAAGVDKNGDAFRDLTKLGFGHVEIGTVTAEEQPGNPRPRVFRLPKQRALINRMGFPNAGAAAVEKTIAADRGWEIVGINIGKSKSAALENAADDYSISVKALARFADFLVVNVSSPNTPGLRDLQAIKPLRALLTAVQKGTAEIDCALLVKISPDLADADIDDITDLALELGLAGIVCTNTTISRDGLPPGEYEDGGLSGEPLKERSLAVLRRIRARAGDKLTLISVGGVSTADDVWDRLAAGATLVQAYSAFVYGGPSWPRRINRDLVRRLDSSDFDSIADVIGSDARP